MFLKSILPLPRIALCLVVLAIGCMRPPEIKQKGGQDTGGGTAERSTPAEVRAAIDLAVKLATTPDIRRNIFVQFWIEQMPSKHLDFIWVPKHLFPLLPTVSWKPWDAKKEDPRYFILGSKTDTIYAVDDVSKFDSPVLKALLTNRWIFKESGDCPQQDDKKHADASVSTHTLNAEICFSVGNLTRLPPSSLFPTVAGLLLHETVHMGGADEDEAEKWQKKFADFYFKRFANITANRVKNQIQLAGVALSNKLRFAQELLNDKRLEHNDPRIFLLLGECLEILYSLPHFLDPLTLELAIKPARPELVNNFTNAVLSVIEKIEKKFLKRKKKFVSQDNFLPFTALTKQQMTEALQEISDGVEIVYKNFDTYHATFYEINRSKCLLPEDDAPNYFEFFLFEMRGYSGGRANYFPPRICDPGTSP